ncbi:gamma-glutamyl hydrolase [Stylonychia lemnae]|uniref:Gamma-glutamyl hydrolase n=1 Tax=Stylonychia lemnae TaxID=5949 RepID=A0A078A216_STYLE|nr:gamma-glutamyl hydrolase [Stylonychia lemnae]|eukprot:CDW76180.1 gamma-glutamyl hydrolase [Stylonychia lemnae]
MDNRDFAASNLTFSGSLLFAIICQIYVYRKTDGERAASNAVVARGNATISQDNQYSEEEMEYYKYLGVIFSIMVACQNSCRATINKICWKYYKLDPFLGQMDSGFQSGIFSLVLVIIYLIQDHPSMTFHDAIIAFFASVIGFICSITCFIAVSKGASGPNSTIFQLQSLFYMLLEAVILFKFPTIIQFLASLLTLLGLKIKMGNSFKAQKKTDNLSQEFYLNQSIIKFFTQWSFRSKYNKNFPEEQYILETNQLFIEDSGGVSAVPIHYDITDRDLQQLLEKVNGVHFTGGGLNLIDKETGEKHVYYKTASKYGIIRQNKKIGLELIFLSLAFAKDLNCLHLEQREKCYFQRQRTSANVKDVQRFDLLVLKQMQTQDISFHLHQWGILYDDYLANEDLHQFFKVNAIDYDVNDRKYLTQIEARKYPIYAIMFHPEYQVVHVNETAHKNFLTVENQYTHYVFKHISKFIHQEAAKNDHEYGLGLENDALRNYDTYSYIVTKGVEINAFAIPDKYKKEQ